MNCLSSGTSPSRTTPVRRWPSRFIRPSYPQLNDDGRDGQFRVRPETLRLVVFTLWFAQGLQVRGRFFQEFSTDTAPEGETTNELLFRIPYRRILYANDAGFLRLFPLSVHSTISSDSFSRSQLARSDFVFIFHKFWEGPDKICEEEPDAQVRHKAVVGTFGGWLDFVTLELSGMSPSPLIIGLFCRIYAVPIFHLPVITASLASYCQN